MVIAPWIRAASAILLLFSSSIGAPARAEQADMIEVGRWIVYGTDQRRVRDSGVPGEGAVEVLAPAVRGDDWAAGAGMPIPIALRAGEEISAVFWARADRPIRTLVMLQAGTAPYTSFARTDVALTPTWQRFTIKGAVPSDLASGSQTVVVQLGKATGDVSLGPVLFLSGKPSPDRIEAALASFRPSQLAEDVRILSAPGVVLAGTLRLPGNHGRGPFPVAVMLAGSGPNKRGAFDRLADRLLADGIATLDYDKRGVGESTGAFVDTVEFMTHDAAAAVAYLRGRPDIDGKRVALVGLSQGGVVGPAVAARDPTIAAVVMLAGPVGSGKEPFFLGEMRAKLVAGGMNGAAIDRVLAATRTFMDARAGGAQDAIVAPARTSLADAFVAGGFTRAGADGAIATIDTPVVHEAYQLAPGETLAQVQAPVLALYASLDTVVPTPLSLPAAKAALRDNADAMVIEVAGVNHWFVHARTGTEEEQKTLGIPVSAPEVIARVGNWLEERLRP